MQQTLGVYPFIKGTYYVKDNPLNHSKKFFYELIAKNERLEFSEICVVGDNYYVDILPATELGCMSVYLSDKEIEGSNYTIKSIYELPKILDTKFYQTKMKKKL
ncbi:MAG: HAD hydrolase-like protein [Candidatus Aenigmatarchaeota archaeon]